MRLLLWHPRLAERPCSHCLTHDYNEKTGEIETDDATGKPLRRLGPEWAPCRLHAEGKKETPCPKGTPENPNTLSVDNQHCYEHYKWCEATGRFPDDPKVMRHAAIIRAIEREYEQEQQQVALLKVCASLVGKP